MTSKYFAAHTGLIRLLAVGLLFLVSASSRAQTVAATVPVGSNPVAVAVNPVTNKIYVANCVPSGERSGTDGTVTVIDGDTNTTTTVPAGICPSAVVVNTVTNKIYVANFGHISLLCGSCFNYGSVLVIDGATNSTATVTDPNAKFPMAVSMNTVTNKIYVANNFSQNVTVIDGATDSITTVPAGIFPFDLAVNPVTDKIYVTSFNPAAAATGTTVTVIDGNTGASTAVTDPNAADPMAVAVNPVTNKIYVANLGNIGKNGTNVGSVTVIDGATDRTTNIVDPNAFGPHAVAVNPANEKIYVANFNNMTRSGNGGVTVIDGATDSFTTVTDPNAGTACGVFTTANLAVDPATDKVYVANCSSNNVTLIDSAANSTTTMADPNARTPTAVAVNPATDKIYVANSGSNNVTVIDGGTATSFTLSVRSAGSGKGTVVSDTAGIDCGSLCSANFASGTKVMLIASPASGSTFSSWSGACSGTGTCSVTMNAAASVTATFTYAQPVFSLSATPSSLVVGAGGNATFTLSVVPGGGFNQAVSLSCTGAPMLATCSVSPASVTPNGTSAATATVTLTTAAPTLTAPRGGIKMPPLGSMPLRHLWVSFLALLLLVVAASWARRDGDHRSPLQVSLPAGRRWKLALALALATVLVWVGCGGGPGPPVTHSPGTPVGTYTLTLTGSSGSLSNSTAVSVTVNP